MFSERKRRLSDIVSIANKERIIKCVLGDIFEQPKVLVGVVIFRKFYKKLLILNGKNKYFYIIKSFLIEVI